MITDSVNKHKVTEIESETKNDFKIFTSISLIEDNTVIKGQNRSPP